mmetsp:Transcript_70929/g.129809  ORF Transcript_70929/g.129809 Transcript_70929/m.129809 type:complete len:311 (-) Transcript_70929:88-1020(-)
MIPCLFSCTTQKFAVMLTCLTSVTHSQQAPLSQLSRRAGGGHVQLARLLVALRHPAAFEHPCPGRVCSRPSRLDSFYSPAARSRSIPCMASITYNLTGRNKRALRAQANALNANSSLVYVRIDNPYSSKESVDRELEIHEMVRAKFVGAGYKKRAIEQAEEIANLVDAAVVQNLGMTALLWRPKPNKRFSLDLNPSREGKKKSRFATEADPNEEITTIFLSKLPLDVSEEQVKTECEALGNVAQALVIKRGTKKDKNGFGTSGAYVRFKSIGEAMDAMMRINSKKVQLSDWTEVTAGVCHRNVKPAHWLE